MLSRTDRVCAYDRAGYGFSTEGPLPRTLDADVADLHALINQAHLATPLRLVGHSLGTNIARRYVERFPLDVAGFVLIDPPAQDIAAFSPKWAKDEATMDKQR
jgi:pimeloyl-ACP methyl ester carboxylesterase